MMQKLSYILLVALLTISCSMNKNGETAENNLNDSIISFGEMYMLIGTYTSNEGSKGIYVYKFDTDTGESDSISMIEVANPSYLVISPNEKFVYSVGENGGG